MMETKPTNPKDAIGSTKLPLHLWPTTATAMGCLALLEGALKYGRGNWREAGVRATIYVDACKRHLDAWLEGEENAPDTGTPHLANALACLAIIVDARAVGKLVDDRNHNGAGYRALVDELTPHVAHLQAMFADKNPKHYTIADNAPRALGTVCEDCGDSRRCAAAGHCRIQMMVAPAPTNDNRPAPRACEDCTSPTSCSAVGFCETVAPAPLATIGAP